MFEALLDRWEVAALLGIAPTSVYNWQKRGDLTPVALRPGVRGKPRNLYRRSDAVALKAKIRTLPLESELGWDSLTPAEKREYSEFIPYFDLINNAEKESHND